MLAEDYICVGSKSWHSGNRLLQKSTFLFVGKMRTEMLPHYVQRCQNRSTAGCTTRFMWPTCIRIRKSSSNSGYLCEEFVMLSQNMT